MASLEENKISKIRIIAKLFDYPEDALIEEMEDNQDWIIMELDIFNMLAVKTVIMEDPDIDIEDVFPSEIMLFHYPVERFTAVLETMKKLYGNRFIHRFFDEDDEWCGENLTDKFIDVDVSLPEKVTLDGTIELIRKFATAEFNPEKMKQIIDDLSVWYITQYRVIKEMQK